VGFLGFGPFINISQDRQSALVYDLTNGNVYEVTPLIARLLSGKTYSSYDEILREGREIGKENIDKIIKEGKANGIIVETNKPYWRNTFISPLEAEVLSKSYSLVFRKIILQPSGRCDKECKNCNMFVNCTCFKDDNEWTERELACFMKDLERFRGLTYVVDIFGGNPLTYAYIEKMILGLNKLLPHYIKLNIPISAATSFVEEKVANLRRLCKTKLIPNYICFPEDKEILLSFLKSKMSGRILLMLSEEPNSDLCNMITKIRKTYRFSTNYLLRRDLENLNWFKKQFNENGFEGVTLYDYYYRKHFHRCWGYSFSIDCWGNLRPCLWSGIILETWKNGKVLESYLDNYNATMGFWEETSLERIEGCSNCVYRFGCKECRVISNFLTGNKKSRNPACIR
jgi:radical SAM protein with 4Fe4S-binding SPASM domain